MGNEVSLLEVARTRSREERLHLFQEMLSEFVTQEGLSSHRMPDGRSVWSYTAPAAGWRPPQLTPEEEAELQRRLDTIDDCLSDEEINEIFQQAGREPTLPQQ